MLRLTRLLLAALLLVFGAGFASLNAGPVTLNYYLATLKAPLSALLVLSFALGVLLTFIAVSLRHYHLKKQIHALHKKLNRSETGETT